MKIAGVHCRMFPWWAFNVFKDLLQEKIKKNPDWDFKVFTLIADHDFKTLEIQIPWTNEYKKIPVIEALPKWISTLFLYFSHHQVRFFSSLFNYRNLIVLYPLLMKILSRKIRIFAPEKILISSFAIAKNITLPKSCNHSELYLHSPMQYIWSHYEEYLHKFSWWKQKLFQWITPRLRNWDKKFTHFDKIYFNSKYTQELAWELYHLQGEVQYPLIQDTFYFAGISSSPRPYYVFVGRLVSFVRECELIIKVFNALKLPLLMIGSGPDEWELKALAGDTVMFLGWLPAEEMKEIVKHAKGLVNLAKESFGIGTVEALLMGVPVLWFNEWWTKELVDQKSGILIDTKDEKTLKQAILQFEQTSFDRKYISEHIRNLLG